MTGKLLFSGLVIYLTPCIQQRIIIRVFTRFASKCLRCWFTFRAWTYFSSPWWGHCPQNAKDSVRPSFWVVKMTARWLCEYRGKTPNSSVFLSGFIGQVVQSKTSQSTIPGRYGRGSQPFVTKMLQHGWLPICLEISVRVCRNRCVSQFYSDYPQAWPSTSVHPRMAWIGRPWKLMAPVVTNVGQDWPTSATDGAAYLAHGREFCENF